MAGFFAGIFYLSLVIYVFVSGLRLLKQCQPNEKTIVLGLLSAWLGFQAQSLISIDNLGISVWGWLLGGSILGLSFAQKEEVKSLNEGSSKNMVKINLFQPLVSLVFLLPIIIFTSSLYKIEHNMFVLKGISSPSFPENKSAVLKFANEVISNPIADPFYKYRATFHLYDMGFKAEAYQAASKLFDNDPINPDFLRGKILFELCIIFLKRSFDVRLSIKYILLSIFSSLSYCINGIVFFVRRTWNSKYSSVSNRTSPVSNS
jgi:hypothetical protein